MVVEGWIRTSEPYGPGLQPGCFGHLHTQPLLSEAQVSLLLSPLERRLFIGYCGRIRTYIGRINSAGHFQL